MTSSKIIPNTSLKPPHKPAFVQKTPINCSDQAITQIIHADCAFALKTLPDQSIDFVITSPPYANQRHHTYGGICADRYVDWFLPIADELYRVLKSTGSFVLNIKEHAVKGERHTYVMNLIIELRKRGWLWTEEYIWHKRNTCPGKWPNRFRDAWERCEHFTKQKEFSMYQNAVMVPMGDWRHSRLQSLKEKDRIYRTSNTHSGFGKKMANWMDRNLAYPDNVLHLPTENRNQGHSAVFPESLPEWFIKLFTKTGDTVLDPFMGSGTTLKVSKRLERHSIGIDIQAEYCALAVARLGLCGYQETLPKTRLAIHTPNTDLHASQKLESIKEIKPSKRRRPSLNKNRPCHSRKGSNTRSKTHEL